VAVAGRATQQRRAHARCPALGTGEREEDRSEDERRADLDVGEGSKNSDEQRGGSKDSSSVVARRREREGWWWLGEERGSEIFGGGSQREGEREGESEFEREKEAGEVKKTKLSL